MKKKAKRPVKAARKRAAKAPKKAKARTRATTGLDPVKTETGKHAGGRPSVYEPRFCQELFAYFSVEPTRTETQMALDKRGMAVPVVVVIPVELPTLSGFAARIGVHRDTLNEWERQHPEFSDTVKRAKVHQERILLANGMAGRYHPTMSIFALKNLADWKDRQEVEVKGTGTRVIDPSVPDGH